MCPFKFVSSNQINKFFHWQCCCVNSTSVRIIICVLSCPQEKAAKWKNPDGHMDGLTTNGVLVMHPKGGFTEESKPGVWREISVCGDVYTLRETRSAQTPGKLVSSFIHTVIEASFY